MTVETRDVPGGGADNGGGPGSVRLARGVTVPDAALRYRATRSSGPGGQHVNKTSTRVELRVALADLPIDDRAMGRLRRLAGSRVTSDDELILASEETRSQRRNREDALERLRELVGRALVPPKRRVATRPSRGSVERRLAAKRERGEKKRLRRPPPESG